MNRSPTDGLPYYCVMCGKGYEHFSRLCTDTHCKLEGPNTAMQRQKVPYIATKFKKAKELIEGDTVYLADGSIGEVKGIDHGSLKFLKGQDTPRHIIIYWQDGTYTQAPREFECEIDKAGDEGTTEGGDEV